MAMKKECSLSFHLPPQLSNLLEVGERNKCIYYLTLNVYIELVDANCNQVRERIMNEGLNFLS